MVANVLLRCAWTLNVSVGWFGYVDNDYLVAALGVAEILRSVRSDVAEGLLSFKAVSRTADRFAACSQSTSVDVFVPFCYDRLNIFGVVRTPVSQNKGVVFY